MLMKVSLNLLNDISLPKKEEKYKAILMTKLLKTISILDTKACACKYNRLSFSNSSVDVSLLYSSYFLRR